MGGFLIVLWDSDKGTFACKHKCFRKETHLKTIFPIFSLNCGTFIIKQAFSTSAGNYQQCCCGWNKVIFFTFLHQSVQFCLFLSLSAPTVVKIHLILMLSFAHSVALIGFYIQMCMTRTFSIACRTLLCPCSGLWWLYLLLLSRNSSGVSQHGKGKRGKLLIGLCKLGMTLKWEL